MKEICSDGCRYSRAMNQPYPRICVDCGHSEVLMDNLDSFNEWLITLANSEVNYLFKIKMMRRLLTAHDKKIEKLMNKQEENK